MNPEIDDDETVRITSDSSDELPFFQRILDDPSILELIPKGATITILSAQSGEQNVEERRKKVAMRAISSFEIGDQTVYILDVPAKDHAAD